MRVLVLVFSLALGSGLAALARDLPDPVAAFGREVERERRHPVEPRPINMWFVDPAGPSADSVYIHELGPAQRGGEC